MAKCDSEYAGYGTSPDLEVGYGARPALYPGIYADENELRWGLIRKVYNILSIQVLLTAAVSAFVVFTPAALSFFAVHPWILFFASITPLICEFSNLSNLIGGCFACSSAVVLVLDWWLADNASEAFSGGRCFHVG